MMKLNDVFVLLAPSLVHLHPHSRKEGTPEDL